jgi:hypothetical protein
LLEGGSRKGASSTNKCRKKWECQNKLHLVCENHGEAISVSCGRWKTCVACRIRKSWEIKCRFLAGIETVPEGRLPMFVTLTFPRRRAPDEDQAHACLRKLVARLRYRNYLGAYGWVLQRQANGKRSPGAGGTAGLGTLHYHGIFHLPWFDDDLKEWRRLVKASGFGSIQNIKPAKPRHAGYVANYISSRLARLEPVRRAYSFSQDFPRSEYEKQRQSNKETRDLLRLHGIDGGCDWLPVEVVESWFR